MKEWYLTSPPPNITSGYENDVISEYAQNNFTDVLETTFSDSVILYNSDLSESRNINCIVQGNVADTHLKSTERTVLFPIGAVASGTYMFFDNSFWLLKGHPGNNKSYEKIVASLCTFKLRWQNKSGDVIERWAYMEDFTKYSSGVISNNNIAVGDNQYGLYLPIDEETKSLKRDMRFAIDFDDAIEPDVYTLTNRKVVLNNYQSSNKGGTIIFTMSYHVFNKETDKRVTLDNGKEVWICDYFSPTPSPAPPDETSDLSASISGNTNFKIGYERTYTVVFKDLDGNEIDSVDFEWNIVSGFDDRIEQTVIGNKIKLKVEDDSLVGESFLLGVTVEDTVLSELIITVIEGY